MQVDIYELHLLQSFPAYLVHAHQINIIPNALLHTHNVINY